MSYYDELTPVHQACREGDAATLISLHDANPAKYTQILNSHPRTPLWWACKTGHPNIVKLLIEHGSPLECNGSATSPLMEAAMNGHVAVVRVLVEKGVDLTKREGEGGNGGVLAIAADKGELDMVKLLVEKGADVNESESAPLLYASGKGHVEVMKYLVEKGAVLHGGYVLACAVYNKKQKVVDWLINSEGVKVDALVDGRTALTLAVRDNMEDMARMLLRNGASPHVKLPRGEPMLFHALSRRYMGVAMVLLQHQAPVDEVYNGETALLLAVRRGNLEVVKTLWHFGADLNLAKGINTTVLCEAIKNCHWEVATYLIERGADVTMRESNKRGDLTALTPLHLLCMQPDHPITCTIAAAVLRNGADVNALYDSGNSKLVVPPIYYAINHRYTEMIWKLAFAGADFTKEVFVDGFPHSVWELSENTQDPETKKALFHFWEPSTHFRHPKKVRDAIVCVMLVAKRQNWGLDTPILQHLLSFIAYGWLDTSKQQLFGR